MAQHFQLNTLMTKYQQKGIIKGGELLLPLEISWRFLVELSKLEVLVLGIDGWYYVNPAEKKIVQDISVGYYVGDDALNLSDRAAESVRRVKDFLSTLNADKTPLVSFILDIPDDWIFFENVQT